MNLREAKELYKKCCCNAFYIYSSYGEDVSSEFEELVDYQLLVEWKKEKFIELYEGIIRDKGEWWDIKLMCEISEEWRKDKELQMLSTAFGKVKYSSIYQKLSAAETIIGNGKYWWKNGLIWNAVRIKNRNLGYQLANQALELLHIEGSFDEEVRKRHSQDLKRCKRIMCMLFIR